MPPKAPKKPIVVTATQRKAAAAADPTAVLKASAADAETMRFSREERTRRFGVDCPDSITFRHWTPGGEYPRKLIIKNTHEKLQVLNYRLPQQKATFFVEFPEAVTLSSGMSFELTVKFRPTVMAEMRDTIEIVVEGRGSFLIDLIALTPYAKLSAPPKHDFGFCPVDAVTPTTLSISNSGTVPLNVVWEVQQPFTIQPSHISLVEGEHININVSFHPTEATAVVAKAVCRVVDTEQVLTVMVLSGIGKYVFVRTPQSPMIDFGGVVTGKVETRTILVENKSCVPATFEIRRSDDDIVNPFLFHPTKGQIDRDSSIKLTVKYRPESTSAHYANAFVLSTVGGNSINFRCIGTAKGPQAQLSVKSLEFGDVNLEVEGKHEKVITLKNKSDVDIQFVFAGCEPGSAFQVKPFNGTLGPQKLQSIAISFTPKAPINYLRRLYVLVKHSDQAQFIDLLGTAYNQKSRPAPFAMKQVQYWYSRILGGLGRSTPEDIETLIEAINSGKPPVDEEEGAARDALTTALANSEGKLAEKAAPLMNLLPPDGRLPLPFSLEDEIVKFGASAMHEVQTVGVRNHTSAKATALWALPQGCPWEIIPESADIAAFSVTQFQIRMNPSAKPTGAFGHFFECFVFHKSMRSFRLVNAETFSPPMCLTLHCQAVPQLNETATPQVTLPTHVAFPACHLHDSVYQVIPLMNMNDTVISFSISIDARLWMPRGERLNITTPEEMARVELEARTAFTCFPPTGTIPPNSTGLVIFKFSPGRLSRYRGVAVVSFNDSSFGGRQILLRGESFVPNLTLANNGVLPFRPTACGGRTVRPYAIENPSRIPVSFKIQIPEGWGDTLSLSPMSGTLKAWESLDLQATFTPSNTRRYEIHVPIEVRATQAPPAHKAEPIIRHLTCHVVGDGVMGVVALEPLEIHFGTVLVGTDSVKTLTVFNSSLCDVKFAMRYIVTAADADAPPLTFSSTESDTLHARSHAKVDVRVKLPHRGKYTYTIYVVSHGSLEAVDMTNPTPDDILRLPHCIVTVSGGHPSLEITDVRSVYQRKSHLWRQLSVTAVNDRLKESVLHQDVETKSFTFESASAGLTPLVLDLGVDTYRTAPIRVLIRLDNTGHCPVNLRFWLPHESEVPKEPWHQDPVAGEGDLELAEIIDRKLFDITPRQATVPVNGHIVVQLTYQHTKVGQHMMPVLLRLDKGKRLLLHIAARTLSESARFLAFHHSLTHNLFPVAIGDLDPPLQYTELQNLSHHTVIYNVESEALTEMREKNFDFPIIQCLNPQGVIPPMSTLLLSWYFRPIEAKAYSCKVNIKVEGGESYELTLKGEGYHPKKITPAQIRDIQAREVFPLPAYPTLKHPLLPLRLSLDVLRFGPVPQHTLHRRLIVLENTHPTDTFVFEWHCVLQYGDQLLDVDPPRGRIAPGQSVQMRLTLYTGSTSHIIDNPIHCHVLNEDLRSRRLARREAAEREAAMQLEMPPTGGDHNATRSSYSTTSGTGAAARKEANKVNGAAPKTRMPITSIPAKFQSTNRLRQAIQQLTDAAAAEELDDDDPELTYVDVLPTVLEVLIQARIMHLQTYTQLYGDTAASTHYYPTFRAYQTPILPEERKALEPFTIDELNMARDVVDELLQHVVHNKGIHDSYCDISEDPVPYFCQMKQLQEQSDDEEETVAAYDEESANQEEPNLETLFQDGELQCLVEEVLEDALFRMVRGGGDDSSDGLGMIQRLLSHGNSSRARRRTGQGSSQLQQRSVKIDVAEGK